MIGGAELYKATLPQAQRLYLTRVDASIEGDAFFPEIDASVWKEISRESFSSSETNPYDYAFCVLEPVS
jgi:dihydrofolate reductase